MSGALEAAFGRPRLGGGVREAGFGRAVSGATIVEADMCDRVTLWRRCVGPVAVVLLSILPMLATGCGYDRTRRTDIQSDGTVIRYWPEKWSPVVVEPKPVPVVDAEYEYTFPRFRDLDKLHFLIRPLRHGQPVEVSELETPAGQAALANVLITVDTVRLGDRYPAADPPELLWPNNVWQFTKDAPYWGGPKDLLRSRSMRSNRAFADMGSTKCRVRVEVHDATAVREIFDQIQFVFWGELPMPFWQL